MNPPTATAFPHFRGCIPGYLDGSAAAALPERLRQLQVVQQQFSGARPPSLSLRGGRRPTWRPEREARGSALGVQSRSTQPDNRVLPVNTAALRDGASRTPPPTRRVRSAGIPGNLQLPKALTERRYRRNRLVRFYRHLVRTGSAFPRLPRRFAPRNDNSEVHTILTMACTDRQRCAGRGQPGPYSVRLAASRVTIHCPFSLIRFPAYHIICQGSRQSTGCSPFSCKKALICENGRLPKKPR